MAVLHKTRLALQYSQHQEICEKFNADDSLQFQTFGMVSDSSSHGVLIRKEQPCARPHHLQAERQEQIELVPRHSGYCLGQFVRPVPRVV